MRLAIAALLFAISMLVGSAQAASFSCAAAATPMETAICGDAVLSETDSTMALAFAHAMAGLTEEAGIVARHDAADMSYVVDDTLQWLFTDAGLMIEFEPEQVVHNGTPAIVVPWSRLEAMMAGNAYAIGVWD